MTGRWTVEIICTDRGQHKRTWLTRSIWDAGHGWRHFISGSPEPKHAMFGPPLADAEPGEVTSRDSYGFACSRCNRWPKISGDRWIELLEGARHAGYTDFDVSYLD
jgi:hypothetical protein